MKYYIGVDLGTSAVKLLLMDQEGQVVNIVSREYPLSFPHPGWSEQNPEDWWEQSKEGIKELISKIDATEVAGISFGGQMHGLVILDENDQVIRPAILWNDGRTTKETDYLNQVIGKEKLSEYTANIAFAGFTAPKLLWVKENEPENFAKICKIMLPKDYLAYCLTSVHCCDYSDASGMLLLDVKNKCWSEQMMEICGVSREQMPELFESYEKVGTLKPEVAKELGLPETCLVAAGAGDNAAAAVGSYHIIYNSYLRDRVMAASSKSHYNAMNVLSMYALIGAYKPEGYEWVDELCRVLSGNVSYACDFIKEHFPGVTLSRPQGTYMLFLDCEEWCKTHGKTIDEVLKAGWDVGVAWQDGRPFFAPYGIRVNLALPLSRVQEAFERLKKYVFVEEK